MPAPLNRKAAPAPVETVERLPWGIVCYGPPGVGKTSLFARSKRHAFIIDPQEEGILQLQEHNQVIKPAEVLTIPTWQQLLALDQAVNVKRWRSLGVDTLVFDSATGFEMLCFEHYCRTNFDNDWSKEGFYSFQQGPKQAAKMEWTKLIRVFDSLRHSGFNIALLAHSVVKPFSNPVGGDHDRFTAYLDKEVWQYTHRWAQAVLFYNYVYNVEKKGPRGKAVNASSARAIFTDWTPTADAKNRCGWPPAIEVGDSSQSAWQALSRLLNS
jgi:hypothetical protein